jgi:bis(5'-nucleosyl)-tetraphosphatase (symmetrical)
MAVYAVGDIQGCHLELLRLLERLRFDPATDRLWLTGDLVNRGPDSLAVLRFVRGLGDAVTVVLGNHDLHLLAVAAGLRAMKAGDEGLESILDAPDCEALLDWLARRPLLHSDESLGWTMIHAGLPPQWDIDAATRCAREVEQALVADRAGFLGAMYGNQPDCWAEGLARPERLRFTVNCLTRLRYVDAAGRLLLAYKGPVESAPRGAVPWFRHPGRLSAGERIVAGHWSALGFVQEDGFVALDTGCVWGGSLCAFRLDGPGDVVRVPCKGALRPNEDRAGAD